jgi:hypothetical protein
VPHEYFDQKGVSSGLLRRQKFCWHVGIVSSKKIPPEPGLRSGGGDDLQSEGEWGGCLQVNVLEKSKKQSLSPKSGVQTPNISRDIP